ncbi:hypothetical protein B7992_14220, partial [Fibrobacter sp. UWH1]
MVRNAFKMVVALALAISSVAFMGCSAGGDDALANRVHKVSDLAHKKVGVQIGNTADIYASEY